ncbi:4'-phosphopantetheinyl transferase superfamily protein [Cryobacterium sp. TMS1-20-1]|uniref:4'-phosphopantetheinyl transferase family protein n=1 Tax=Cryobacterium sp. TMS1-20-1 TaxID=1259223 RepID=UPI00141AE9A8|nr:4'-phosphopantetheinyl transferase superfamily protein [Cryobacterium sp. TMS1-20-1]
MVATSHEVFDYSRLATYRGLLSVHLHSTSEPRAIWPAGFDLSQEALKMGEYGKPYLANIAGIYFNKSDTVGATAIAVSQYVIGIDIEKIKQFDTRIPERFFTPEESKYILTADHVMRNERFSRVWTRKEAFVKWSGRGLSQDFRSFDVLRNPSFTTVKIKSFVLSVYCPSGMPAETQE